MTKKSENIFRRSDMEKFAPTALPEGNDSFCRLAWDWMEFIQPQVRASTMAKYRNLIRSYIVPQFEQTPLDLVTEDVIRNHCNYLLRKGGRRHTGLSPKTVSDTLSVIRGVLRYAQREGLHVPCTGREVTIRQLPGRTSGELCVLRRGEQELLYDRLRAAPSEKDLGILICMFTGLRIGEVCALKWSDISLREKTLRVHQTMQRIQIVNAESKKTAVIVTPPKSASSNRTIPLPDNLTRIIKKNFPARQGYVLTGSDCRFAEPRVLQRYFRRVLKKNHIRPVNFHALRHTFATRCVEVGFDVKSLSEILGHSNVSITMNRYVHPTMELKSENMQRLSKLFSI